MFHKSIVCLFVCFIIYTSDWKESVENVLERAVIGRALCLSCSMPTSPISLQPVEPVGNSVRLPILQGMTLHVTTLWRATVFD